MAAIVVSDDLLINLLESFFNSATVPPDYYVRLYENNHSPAANDATSAFVECSIAGYAAEVVSNGSWTVTNPSVGEAHATGTTVTFTLTGPGTVYGYYVTDSSNAQFWWGQLFDTPITLPGAGGVITFDPDLTNVTPIP